MVLLSLDQNPKPTPQIDAGSSPEPKPEDLDNTKKIRLLVGFGSFLKAVLKNIPKPPINEPNPTN